MTDSNLINSQFNHFELISQFNEQIHVKASCLFRDPERAQILEFLLGKRNAVQSVQAFPDMASVAIRYDPVQLPLEKLFALLDTLLANIGSKVSGTVKQMKTQFPGNSSIPSRYALQIQGLRCGSCAVALEMALCRDNRIQDAQVNYASESALINGQLSPLECIALIQKHGFDAIIGEGDTE